MGAATAAGPACAARVPDGRHGQGTARQPGAGACRCKQLGWLALFNGFNHIIESAKQVRLGFGGPWCSREEGGTKGDTAEAF